MFRAKSSLLLLTADFALKFGINIWQVLCVECGAAGLASEFSTGLMVHTHPQSPLVPVHFVPIPTYSHQS